MTRIFLLPFAASLAVCPIAACLSPTGPHKVGDEAAASVIVRFAPDDDSVRADHVTVVYQGLEFKFSKSDSIDACGFDQVAVVKQLPLPRWSVALKLSMDSGRILEGKDRALFGVFVDDAVRYVGPWLPWHPDQLDVDCDSREDAYQLAATFSRALTASRAACGRAQARFEVKTVVKRPSSNLLPAVEILTPPVRCSEEMKRRGLRGELLVRGVIHEDGTMDPQDWKVLRGDAGIFTSRFVEQAAKTWKFRPGFEDGEPQATQGFLRIKYDCTKDQ